LCCCYFHRRHKNSSQQGRQRTLTASSALSQLIEDSHL
jgi:hypothetical protein